jgi:hypothetical protein
MSNDHARARIAENRHLFDGLIEEAARAVEGSRFRSAAVTLQTAARFASNNHPGVYRSLRLESLAVEIGEHLVAPQSRRPGLRIDVLHVLTQAYSSGGHTRLAWRWIENDTSRVHSVVLTGQQGIPVPRELRQAVEGSGGSIIRLGTASDNLLARAKQLRRIASDRVGVVVLHIHPYDIVPLIALAKAPVPVIFLNHADHVFWIGGAITDVLADIRPAGHALSLSRRHFLDHNSAILPIPLRERSKADKRQARRLLGLSQDAIVILSIAADHKYAAPQGRHFIDVHRDFVMANPNVNIIVVGPNHSGRWRTVSAETGGRFQAVGIVEELGAYYDAADIYVDSFPFSSLTSLIDAGVGGLPVLGLNESVAHSVLTSDDISLPAGAVQFSTRGEYIHELQALTSQPQYRRQASVRVRNAIRRDHLSPGWNRHLEHLFGMLQSGSAIHRAPPLGLPETNIDEQDQVDFALVDIHDTPEFSKPLWKCQLQDARFRPILQRVPFVLAAPAGQRAKSLRFLFRISGKWRRLRLRSRTKVR